MKIINKYLIYRYMLFVGVFTLFACTGDFKNMNTDEDGLPEHYLDIDGLRFGSALNSMMIDVIPASDVGANDYQRAQNLTGDIFSGHLSAIGNWNGSSNNSTYNLRFDGWNDVMFKVAFRTIMPNWKSMVNNEEIENDQIAYALAQVIKVMAMHRCADNYGPLPYFKFGHGGAKTPYDSQEAIYNSFFEDLNEAIEILEDFAIKNPNKLSAYKKYDLIYEGDISKWAKLANTLKLRLAMRIVYVEPEKAKKCAEEATDTSTGLGVMDEGAFLHSANGYVVYHPLRVIWAMYGETSMGASMESFLSGYKDNRLEKYFSISEIGDGEFHGARNGIMVSNSAQYKKLSTPNIEASNSIKWMSTAEAYFLRAEGALRGWNMGGTAKELYEEGVTASFSEWGAKWEASYLTDNTAKPVKFEDVVGSSSIQARSTITPVYNESALMEENLERIITQKWIALYPEGQEAWSEFRRTGYPKIFPVANNFSNSTIDTEKQIRRVLFPQEEYDGNGLEVAKAISLLGGPDTGGTKLWWDKK